MWARTHEAALHVWVLICSTHTFPFGNSAWPVVGLSINTLSKDPHIAFRWKIQHHGKYLYCRGNLTFTVTFLSVKHSVEGKMPKEQGARQSPCLWGEIKLCLFSSLVLILTNYQVPSQPTIGDSWFSTCIVVQQLELSSSKVQNKLHPYTCLCM